jgi:hypothetical protein
MILPAAIISAASRGSFAAPGLQAGRLDRRQDFAPVELWLEKHRRAAAQLSATLPKFFR